MFSGCQGCVLASTREGIHIKIYTWLLLHTVRMHTHAWTHVHMAERNNARKAVIVPESVFFFFISSKFSIDGSQRRKSGDIDQGEERRTETHSSLRGQRRKKGCIPRKWPNEKEYGSRAERYSSGSTLLVPSVILNGDRQLQNN